MLSILAAAFLIVDEPQMTGDEACRQVGNFAYRVMQERQDNAPLYKTLGLANGAEPELRELIRKMIFEAYESPAFLTAEFKEKSAKQFANKWELKCHRSGDTKAGAS